MEATKLPKKKIINKGKLKRTIKNVICRPDTILWPCISEEQCKCIELLLTKHKVEIPVFKKPHWNELKTIPKDKRPKPPTIKKLDGLLFGKSECSNALQNGECIAILLEEAINPQVIMHSVLEECIALKVPVVCLKDLRKTTVTCFVISTSCLGIKNGFFGELKEKVAEFSKSIGFSEQEPLKTISCENSEIKDEVVKKIRIVSKPAIYPYLHRSDKKHRAFVPPSVEQQTKINQKKQFIGQDFIEFSDIQTKIKPHRPFMKMVLKKIVNNPAREGGSIK